MAEQNIKKIYRNLVGLEDLLVGTGTATQTRNGQAVSITKINAGNLPFDETSTLYEKVAETLTARDEAVLSASNVAISESNVSNLALAAAQSESNASDSKAAALAAQIAAEAAQAITEQVLDAFDDKYLGSKADDPTLDNDGNPLEDGALYYNTTSNALKVYDLGTTTWIAIPQIYLSTLNDVELTSISTGELLVWNGAKWVNQTLAEAGILQSSDIGATVQGYDATTLKSADIGVTVQPYDVDTAKLDVVQTFTASQRGTITTDNDGSFDLNTTNNFSCTPSGTFALTFTNITAGQSGQILLDNSGGHIITADTNTKVDANFLSTVSTAGIYVLGYFSNGTSVYVYNSGAMV